MWKNEGKKIPTFYMSTILSCSKSNSFSIDSIKLEEGLEPFLESIGYIFVNKYGLKRKSDYKHLLRFASMCAKKNFFQFQFAIL
jgi:hypothetical protein